jgi:hypothetical protein
VAESAGGGGTGRLVGLHDVERFEGPAVGGWGSLDAAPHRASAGHDGFAWLLEIAVGRELVQSWPW